MNIIKCERQQAIKKLSDQSRNHQRSCIGFSDHAFNSDNGGARTLKKLPTSKGDYCIKQ